MKISTRGRYGLKAMVDIAKVSNGFCDKCISLKSVAERQGISENYLEQLFVPLKKAGLLKSKRGAMGGYSLAKPSPEISVGDVLRALEGSLAPVDCVSSEGLNSCSGGNCGTCSTKGLWGKIYGALNDVVDNVSIDDLAKDIEK